MPAFTCSPPIEAGVTPDAGDVFVQTIELRDGDRLLARAKWSSNPDTAVGVAQLLELWVAPESRRQGNGRRLMEELTRQAVGYYKARKSRLRRVWAAIAQKRDVIARSFLMRYTFHHVGTVKELLRDEDMLVYMRTMD
ncbi:MAG TPA: GNAT family N-acetyltransferase [Tepidisphaeraceae bacterium]|nr:GNAT family N-acetyltransferase [Tepidisphaeraceae bacterium]